MSNIFCESIINFLLIIVTEGEVAGNFLITDIDGYKTIRNMPPYILADLRLKVFVELYFTAGECFTGVAVL